MRATIDVCSVVRFSTAVVKAPRANSLSDASHALVRVTTVENSFARGRNEKTKLTK